MHKIVHSPNIHINLYAFTVVFVHSFSMFLQAKPWLLTLLNLLFLFSLPCHAFPRSIIPPNHTCHDTCGNLAVKYPFGSSYGCGHPDFSKYIKCDGGDLQLSTASGIYTISSIDYATGTLVASDPLMSTCSSMQNSGSFSLDGATPFRIMPDNVFALVGCSRTSPVFDPDSDLCDTGSGLNVCRGLYSCKGVVGIGLEPYGGISTCCVYDPVVGVGEGRGFDLAKLQCSSYSVIYGFGGDEGDPMKWEYGVLLGFNGSYESGSCKNCEDSGGFCGFSGLDETFSCKCRNGVNTTVNCYGRGYTWSGTWRGKIQTSLTIGGFLISWMVAFI